MVNLGFGTIQYMAMCWSAEFRALPIEGMRRDHNHSNKCAVIVQWWWETHLFQLMSAIPSQVFSSALLGNISLSCVAVLLSDWTRHVTDGTCHTWDFYIEEQKELLVWDSFLMSWLLSLPGFLLDVGKGLFPKRKVALCLMLLFCCSVAFRGGRVLLLSRTAHAAEA